MLIKFGNHLHHKYFTSSMQFLCQLQWNSFYKLVLPFLSLYIWKRFVNQCVSDQHPHVLCILDTCQSHSITSYVMRMKCLAHCTILRKNECGQVFSAIMQVSLINLSFNSLHIMRGLVTDNYIPHLKHELCYTRLIKMCYLQTVVTTTINLKTITMTLLSQISRSLLTSCIACRVT